MANGYSGVLCCFLFVLQFFSVICDISVTAEVDALYALKINLVDPNHVLESWVPTLHPCTWFHVTCNSENSVTRVNLGNGNLSGQLVPQLGHLANLQYLELYNNNITGRIPEELGNLTNLVSLDLYMNKLDGPIPTTLYKLTKLQFLRLSNNTLSGTIPVRLTTITTLRLVDLSNNQLTGDIPMNGSFSLFTSISFDHNRLNPPLPPLPTSRLLSNAGGSARKIVEGVVGALLFVVFVVILLALCRQRTPQDQFFDVPAEEDHELHLGQLKRFSIRELQAATDNFSSINIVGRGRHAVVYKGRLTDGSLVAIKKLNEWHTHGAGLQFHTEVEMIGMAVHRNLLRLLGFCITVTERLLVYPFMVNGSVASCLKVRPQLQEPLSWLIRKQIALGSARGLAYLHNHCDPKIIHRDVKPANILLDEEFEAVVGDFGLAKLVDYKDTHVISRACGTLGHVAPEYYSNGTLSEKTDVFAYGVMLLELISGKALYIPELVESLRKEKKWEQIVDCNLNGNYIKKEVEQLFQVAFLCTKDTAKDRPTMSKVVRMLEGDGLDEIWKGCQTEEIFCQDFNHQYAYTNRIVDFTSHNAPDELSGPR